jgi:hypothetical protein
MAQWYDYDFGPSNADELTEPTRKVLARPATNQSGSNSGLIFNSIIHTYRYTVNCLQFQKKIAWYFYRVSHLTWNPPQQPATAAAVSEVLGNDIIAMQNIADSC